MSQTSNVATAVASEALAPSSSVDLQELKNSILEMLYTDFVKMPYSTTAALFSLVAFIVLDALLIWYMKKQGFRNFSAFMIASIVVLVGMSLLLVIIRPKPDHYRGAMMSLGILTTIVTIAGVIYIFMTGWKDKAVATGAMSLGGAQSPFRQ